MKWFDNLKFRNKFLIVMGVLACIMVSFAVYIVVQVTNIREDISEIVRNQQQQVILADAMVHANSIIVGNLVRGYMAEAEQFENVVALTLSRYDNDIASFTETVNLFRELVTNNKGIIEEDRQLRLNLLHSIEVSYHYYMSYVDKLIVAVENNDSNEVALIMESVIPAGNILNSRLLSLRDLTFSASRRTYLEGAENAYIVRNVVIIVAIGFIIIVLSASLFAANSITKPTAELAKAVTEIANGNLEYKIRSDREDELGILANSISDMIEKLSEHHKTEEALYKAEMASQAKSSFMSHISHEIRTPMNAILGATEIQLQKDTNTPDVEEALGTIYDSGNMLLSIISDLLDFSKIEAGKLELMPGEYDVASLINDTMQLSLMRYESKPIEFVLDIDENTPYNLYGDVLRIKQILNNILSNAFKYTDEGTVELSVQAEINEKRADDIPKPRTDCVLTIRISDTGYGMTDEQIDMLFEEYTRFHSSTNQMTVGTGLGMAITKRLVDLMDGEITVESVPGAGSIFTVSLPQEFIGSARCGPNLAGDLNARRYQSQSKSKQAQIIHEYMPYGSVLVVDDVGSNLYVAKGILLPYGLKIDTVASGFEAFEKIKNGAEYDIVFMDYMMPKMDGLVATKKIRELGYTKPIVVLTANVAKGQEDMFYASGCDDYMHKPIDIRELNALLNRMIRDKQKPEVIESARKEMKKQKADADLNALIKIRIYDELLIAVLRDAENAISVLEDVMHDINAGVDADIGLYTTTVHGMKSPLSNLGETELSYTSHKLEQAGYTKDIDAIKAETPAYIEALKAFIKKSTPKKKGKKTKVSKDDMEFLRERLKKILKACDAFNIRTAKAVMTELKEKTWPDEVSEIIEEISWDLTRGDFTKVASGVEKAKEVLDRRG